MEGAPEICSDVVEAACMIHDLGHPPFGHVAEEELDHLLRNRGVADGFNGNAQSFRIVTVLSVREGQLHGLDLTRATLDATLKYPWLRQTGGRESEKWGAYYPDRDAFEFARKLHSSGGHEPCTEARIMDWADDVAYSVHDIEDFYRTGLIPLDRIVPSLDEEQPAELEAFTEYVMKSPRRSDTTIDARTILNVMNSVFVDRFPTVRPYRNRLLQQAGLSQWKSDMVSRYDAAINLKADGNDAPQLEINEGARREVFVLKELTWYYVIDNPSLASVRYGQRRIIRTLFRVLARAVRQERAILPTEWQDWLGRLEMAGQTDKASLLRLVSDLIASLTEREAVRMFRQMTGASAGAVLRGQTE